MDSLIYGIIAVVAAVLASIFKVQWSQGKKVIKELKDPIIALNKALEDDKITEEEMKGIVKEVQEAIQAGKVLFKLEQVLFYFTMNPKISDLESIINLTRKTNCNIYEILGYFFEVYKRNKKIAYISTMKYIYERSENYNG